MPRPYYSKLNDIIAFVLLIFELDSFIYYVLFCL